MKLFDPQAVADAVRLIVGDGQVTELRALDATTTSDRWPHTQSGYFDAADKLAAALATIKTAKGIYFIPNAVDAALLARAANRIRKTPKGESTADTNIVRRRWLLIDADPQRPSGISATDAERDAAIQRTRDVFAWLRDRGWPDPIAADSGNGGHLLYRVDLPANDGGLVQRCLEALAKRFDDAAVKIDTGVFNPARIWKLYGTAACKGDSTPERPHRMSRILNAPDALQCVPAELLDTLAGPASNAASGQHKPHTGNGKFDLDAFIARYLDADGPHAWNGNGRCWELRQSPMCEHGGDGVFVAQKSDGTISAGCHHASCKGRWQWADLRQRFEPKPSSNGSGSTNNTKTEAADPIEPPRIERFEPFPTDALPEPIRGFVVDAAKAIGCDTSYVALPMLCTLASAIGNSRRLLLKRGWAVPAIVWAAIVGESGTAKSPAFKLCMRAIRERQRKALEEHAEKMKAHEVVVAKYEKELAAWKRKVGGGEPPKKDDAPQAVRFIVSDTTVEALAPLLLANPRGLLLARDELNGWLGSFDRYAGKGKSGGADSAHWLSMHGGESIIVDRKTGIPRTIYVASACVSVCGGIQPGILNRALGVEHRESGLAARLLLTCPPRKAKRWTEADIDPTAEERIGRVVRRLHTLELNDGEPVFIGMNTAAKHLWREYFNAHAREQVDLSGELAAAWSKLEEYAARLALVVHYARWAADDPTLQHPDRVDESSMAAGIKLAEWFKHEARRVYAMMGEPDESAGQRRLLEWVERRGGSCTARDVAKGCRWLSNSADADAALCKLVKADVGRWEASSGGRGQPTRRFVLNTVGTVGVGTNTENPAEKTNTADADNADTSKHDIGTAAADAWEGWETA